MSAKPDDQPPLNPPPMTGREWAELAATATPAPRWLAVAAWGAALVAALALTWAGLSLFDVMETLDATH